MAGGGGGGGSGWLVALFGGAALVAAGTALHGGHGALGPGLLGFGGLSVIFGSCEAMIRAVEGLGERQRWNEFVAGTISGLASNVPEIVMLAFVILKNPRVAFVVVALTLHVNALVLGIYCACLPQDESGHAQLPEAMVRLSTDMFACASGIFMTTGGLMIMMRSFSAGDHRGEGLGELDLYFMGVCLLLVQTVAVTALVRRFAGATSKAEGARDEPVEAPPTLATILGYGLLGTGASLIGGHAVGEFADALVVGLRAQGVSEMVGAILISLFAGSGAFLMALTSHVKGKHDLALANLSGAVSQVPFVVMPICMIMTGVFARLGMVPYLESGAVLPIDLETTSVMLFGFPVMLILYKSVQDDGRVNAVETAGMVAVFALIVFFLAVHG